MVRIMSKVLASSIPGRFANLVSGSSSPVGGLTWQVDLPLSYLQFVRPLLLGIALAACRSERTPPDPPAAPAPTGIDQPKRSIDITVIGAPVTIRGVELQPAPAPGSLELGYRVDATGPAVVPARIMCRVGERNLVYPASAVGKVAGPRLTSQFRADPFVETPGICEVAFLYAPAEHAELKVIARACFDSGVLRDGACPATSFAPPQLASAGAVVIERASLEMRDSTVVVTGLFTLTQPLERERRFLSTIRCADAKGTASGEGDLAFVPLATLPQHASVFGPLTIFVDRTPDPDARCTLTIASRSVTGSVEERVHAQYCLTTRDVRAGGC